MPVENFPQTQNPFEQNGHKQMSDENAHDLVVRLLQLDPSAEDAKKKLRHIIFETHPDRNPNDTRAAQIARAASMLMMQTSNSNTNLSEAHKLLKELDPEYQNLPSFKSQHEDPFGADFWRDVEYDAHKRRGSEQREQRTTHRKEKQKDHTPIEVDWILNNPEKLNKQLQDAVKTNLSEVFIAKFDITQGRGRLDAEDLFQAIADPLIQILQQKYNDPTLSIRKTDIEVENDTSKEFKVIEKVSLFGKPIFTYTQTIALDGQTRGKITEWNSDNVKKGIKRLLKYYQPR